MLVLRSCCWKLPIFWHLVVQQFLGFFGVFFVCVKAACWLHFPPEDICKSNLQLASIGNRHGGLSKWCAWLLPVALCKLILFGYPCNFDERSEFCSTVTKVRLPLETRGLSRICVAMVWREAYNLIGISEWV